MLGRIVRNYQAAFSGLPREIWYLSIVMLINRTGSMVLPFLSLYVKNELGLGESAAGPIVACFGVGSCIGSFCGGYFSDRFGPFRVQIFSLLGNAVGFAALSQMRSFNGFAITLFLTSAVADLFRPANGASMTFLSPPEVHRKAFVLNRLAINLGFTVGPLVGGILAFYSYQWLFWVNSAACVMAACVFYLLLGSRLTAHPANAVVNFEAQTRYRSPLSDGRFLFFITLNFMTFAVFFQLLSTYPLFLNDEFRLKEFEIGLLLGFNTLLVVLFEMVLIESIKSWSVLRTIAWGSLLMCWGFSVLPFGHGFWFAAGAVFIWSIGEMLAMPQMLTYVTSLSTKQNRSRYLGMYMFSVSLALVVGPLVGTRLYKQDHIRFWHWGTLIGIIVLAGFYSLSYCRQRLSNTPSMTSIDLSGE